MKALAAATLIAAVALVALIALSGGRHSSCASVDGGEEGAEAQLRYVDVGERQITFTFGPSSFSDSFGVPRFVVGSVAASRPPELDTGTQRLEIAVRGASGFNPDLTPSYRGASVSVPPTSRPLREAAIT